MVYSWDILGISLNLSGHLTVTKSKKQTQYIYVYFIITRTFGGVTFVNLETEIILKKVIRQL